MTGEPHALAACSAADLELLGSQERPIVLVRRRPDARIAPSVAPGADRVGLVLPYSPLHHLLWPDFGGPFVTAPSVAISSSTLRCSGSRPRSSPTTSTPSTCRPSGHSSRTPKPSASSTITRTPPPASPSTARRVPRSRSSSTAPATGRMGRSGARSSSAATLRRSSASPTSSRSRSRAERRSSGPRRARVGHLRGAGGDRARAARRVDRAGPSTGRSVPTRCSWPGRRRSAESVRAPGAAAFTDGRDRSGLGVRDAGQPCTVGSPRTPTSALGAADDGHSAFASSPTGSSRRTTEA